MACQRPARETSLTAGGPARLSMGFLHEDVTLAILAGGRARRLGGLPKGLLLHEGKPLLAHLLALGPDFAETLLVTSNPAPYQGFPVRSVADLVTDRGAPGGVHTALVHARTPWVLVVAVDMPFVTAPVVERLLTERGAAVDAVGFEVDGRLEPLLACYRSALAATWGTALASSPSLRTLWHMVRTKRLSKASLQEVDPTGRAVVSVNSPEEVAAFAIGLPAAAR